MFSFFSPKMNLSLNLFPLKLFQFPLTLQHIMFPKPISPVFPIPVYGVTIHTVSQAKNFAIILNSLFLPYQVDHQGCDQLNCISELALDYISALCPVLVQTLITITLNYCNNHHTLLSTRYLPFSSNFHTTTTTRIIIGRR